MIEVKMAFERFHVGLIIMLADRLIKHFQAPVFLISPCRGWRVLNSVSGQRISSQLLIAPLSMMWWLLMRHSSLHTSIVGSQGPLSGSPSAVGKV